MCCFVSITWWHMPTQTNHKCLNRSHLDLGNFLISFYRFFAGLVMLEGFRRLCFQLFVFYFKQKYSQIILFWYICVILSSFSPDFHSCLAIQWSSLSPWTPVGTAPQWGTAMVWQSWSRCPSWPSRCWPAWGTCWSWPPSTAGRTCSRPATSSCSAWPCPTCCCPCWCCRLWQWVQRSESGSSGWCGATSPRCSTCSSARPACWPSERSPSTGWYQISLELQLDEFCCCFYVFCILPETIMTYFLLKCCRWYLCVLYYPKS